MGQLSTYVHVHDDNGKPHIFGPADVVPDWAREKITNPKAWADSPAGDASPADPSDVPASGQEPGPPASDLPPRSGRGSGKEAWAAYAAAHDVEVPAGASREEIIEVLQKADVPVDPAAE